MKRQAEAGENPCVAPGSSLNYAYAGKTHAARGRAVDDTPASCAALVKGVLDVDQPCSAGPADECGFAGVWSGGSPLGSTERCTPSPRLHDGPRRNMDPSHVLKSTEAFEKLALERAELVQRVHVCWRTRHAARVGVVFAEDQLFHRAQQVRETERHTCPQNEGMPLPL